MALVARNDCKALAVNCWCRKLIGFLRRRQVGPRTVADLGDALSCLRVWCNTALVGSRLGVGLRDALVRLYLDLCRVPGGALVRGAGPVDAQMCFVEALLKLGAQGLDPTLALSVVQAVGQFLYHRRNLLRCRIQPFSKLKKDK